MNVEQRLHRAAHELRELPLDTPDFEPAPRSHLARRMVAAVAAALLFLVGGALLLDPARSGAPDEFAGVAAGASVAEARVDNTGVDGDGSGTTGVPMPTPHEPTPHEEVAMIASLSRSDITSAVPGADPLRRDDLDDERIPARVN